eukprot:191614-Chlamydomonas_euryale.AAC.3
MPPDWTRRPTPDGALPTLPPPPPLASSRTEETDAYVCVSPLRGRREPRDVLGVVAGAAEAEVLGRGERAQGAAVAVTTGRPGKSSLFFAGPPDSPHLASWGVERPRRRGQSRRGG